MNAQSLAAPEDGAADPVSGGPGSPRLLTLLAPAPEQPREPALTLPRPLPPGGALSAEEQAWLDRTARAAKAGDAAARAALWTVLQPRFDRWAWRAIRRFPDDRGLWRDGEPWLLADLRQEGFPILLGVLKHWRGETGFFPYVLFVAPGRIGKEWRAMRQRLPMIPSGPQGIPELEDGSAAAEEARALLAAIAAGMDETDGKLLMACIADGRSMAAAGREIGVGRREAQRRFDRIRARLRRDLAPDRE